MDPFTRKDWYDVKAPSVFKVRDVGKTLVNRTQGTRIASDGLKGRVYEVSLADLQNEQDAERSFKKFKLICEEVQGKNCLTNFYGMGLTTDKLRSMVKKWQTLIEAYADVKTTDGYLLRVFCIGFTAKQQQQVSKTCYAQSQQVSVVDQCGETSYPFPIMHDDKPNPFSEAPSSLRRRRSSGPGSPACQGRLGVGSGRGGLKQRL